jgi:hypothetical protein
VSGAGASQELPAHLVKRKATVFAGECLRPPTDGELGVALLPRIYRLA